MGLIEIFNMKSLEELHKEIFSNREWINERKIEISNKIKPSIILDLNKYLLPLSAFFNAVTFVAEILEYLDFSWKKKVRKKEITKDNVELHEKVMDIRYNLLSNNIFFVNIFSVTEFTMKEVLIAHSEYKAARNITKKMNTPWNIKIEKDILDPSREENVIDDGDLNKWNALRKLRNMAVHNNGISNIDLTQKMTEITIVLEQDKQTTFKGYDSGLYLTKDIIRLYLKWLENLFD